MAVAVVERWPSSTNCREIRKFHVLVILSRAVTVKNAPKSVIHVQSCRFIYLKLLPSDVIVAVAVLVA